MHIRIGIILLLQIALSNVVAAQDIEVYQEAVYPQKVKDTSAVRTPALYGTQRVQSAIYRFQNAQLLNPAQRYHMLDFSHTEFAVGTSEYNDEEAVVEQEGTDYKGTAFQSRAQQVLSPTSRTWASALYSNGKRDVYRNLTSDYDLLYPYMTGDTLEDKRLTTETYALGAGYAQQLGVYTWGIDATVRNMQEYGLNDPRTRNRVMDVDLKLGVTRRLYGSPYALGMAFLGGSYKQSQAIVALSNERRQIVSPVYHFTGLGMAYNSSEYAWSYEMYDAGVDLSLYPVDHQGLITQLRYQYTDMRKRYAGASSVYQAMQLGMDRFYAGMGWIDRKDGVSWGLKGSYIYQQRIGAEALEGPDPSIGTSPTVLLGMSTNYREVRQEAELDAFFERSGRWTWSVNPRMQYRNNKADYLHPARYTDWERLVYHLDFAVQRIVGKSYFRVQLVGGYDRHLSSAMDLSNKLYVANPNSTQVSFDNKNMDTEYLNFRFLSTDSKYVAASARWEFKAFANKALFVQPNIRQSWYTEGITNNMYQLQLGLVL